MTTDRPFRGQTCEHRSAVVVRGTDERNAAVTLCIGVRLRRGKVDGGFERRLNLDYVARTGGKVIPHVRITLGTVQVVVRNRLHIESPAGVPSRTEEVVDHVRHRANAHRTKSVQRCRLHPQGLIRPQHLRLFRACSGEHVAVEARHLRSGNKAKLHASQQRLLRPVVVLVQRDDLVSGTQQR